MTVGLEIRIHKLKEIQGEIWKNDQRKVKKYLTPIRLTNKKLDDSQSQSEPQ